MTDDKNAKESLPKTALDFIDAVVKKVRYRKKIRQEVRAELTDHFYMALKDSKTVEEKLQAVDELIAEFGDLAVLASLIRRGKKRCRPLWKKAVFAAMKIAGVLLLLVILRAGYFCIGTSVISVDYGKWLNDFVRDGRDESLNAYPYYEKAVELGKIDVPESLKVLLNSDEGITSENIADTRAYIKLMEPAFAALRQGSTKPYCWAEYEVDYNEMKFYEYLTSQLVDKRMPFLGSIKRLIVRVREIGIVLKLHDGDVAGAIDDSLVIMRLGQHMEDKGLLIEQLVGIAVEAVGFESVNNIIQTEEVSGEMLAKCLKQLESFIEDDNLMNDFRAEKVFHLDYIQRTFTDDGKGNGRILLKGLPMAVKGNKELVTGFVMGNYPDRREAIASVDSFFDEFSKFTKNAPWKILGEGYDAAVAEMTADLNWSMKIQGPSLLKVRLLSWRAMTSRRAMIAICGIHRYKKDKGEYPADLDAVVSAGYIKENLIDPFSGKGFVYRLTEDSFILYSLGTDMDDDGGIPYINSNGGRERKWGDGSGDSIFWPVLNRE